jgi:LPS export ABC transporter protein LptC
MNRIIFYGLLSAGASLLFCMVLFMFWYTKTPQKPQLQNPEQFNSAVAEIERTSSQEVFTNITITNLTLKELERTKELEVIVNAQECKFLQPSDTIECSQVTCTLLDHQLPRAQLKTDKALINRTQKTILFSGSVFGNIKDVVIHGTDINYNFSQQILRTDKNTEYTHPDFYISAQKSFVDIKGNYFELYGGVINEFNLPHQ